MLLIYFKHLPLTQGNREVLVLYKYKICWNWLYRNESFDGHFETLEGPETQIFLNTIYRSLWLPFLRTSLSESRNSNDHYFKHKLLLRFTLLEITMLFFRLSASLTRDFFLVCVCRVSLNSHEL